MTSSPLPVPAKVQRLLAIVAKYTELAAAEDEGYRNTRCWTVTSSAQYKQGERVWIYWTPAANGGSVRVHRFYGGSSKPAKITQSQAYITLAMLAGH